MKLGLTLSEAIEHFQAYGHALAQLEPVDKLASARLRMEMQRDIFGVGRFMNYTFWRWAWIAYGPKT